MDIKISQCIGDEFMNECAFNTTNPTYLEYHDYYWDNQSMIAKNYLS